MARTNPPGPPKRGPRGPHGLPTKPYTIVRPGAEERQTATKSTSVKKRVTRYKVDKNPVTVAKHKIPARRGTMVAKEIKKYQNTVENLIPRKPFVRLVREVAAEYKIDVRFQDEAFDVIQAAAEAFLVSYFKRANIMALHAKRITITPRDMMLVSRLWQELASM